MKKTVLCLLLLFMPSVVLAYIPPYWMIMSRVAENHGRGIYQVDQRVSFSHGEENLSVRERWFIKDSEEMRLEVVGLGALKDKIRLTFIYQNGKKYYVDPNGVRKSSAISKTFLEPYFYFRRSKIIKPMLVARDITPAVSLQSKSHRYSKEKPTAEQEPYVRLARTGGKVAYALGKGPSAGIWIEQDQFHILKIRFSNELEVAASNYSSHSRGAWLPNERQITFKSNQANMVLSKVVGLSGSKKNKELFMASSLQFGKDPKVATLLPEDQIIQDFYINLR